MAETFDTFQDFTDVVEVEICRRHHEEAQRLDELERPPVGRPLCPHPKLG